MLFRISIHVHRLFIVAFALLALPLSLYADGGATIGLSPGSGSFGVGKTFTVQVTVDSSQSFNSANATLSFDPSMLSVSGISKSSSAFSLWAVDPSSDNSKGTVSFEGGNTAPLSGKKALLAVTFKALKEGKADISFTAASVLAADGKGTDIAGTKGSASFDITATGSGDTQASPPPTPDPAPTGPKPDLPEITSTTHPIEDQYSDAPTAKFSWNLPDDVTVVRLSLDAKADTIPTTSYDPAIAEKEIDQLSDGVMYFHLRFENDAGWGPTAHKKIMVDKTPPAMPSVEATVAGSSTDVKLAFDATDTLSGIDHYEISVDGESPAKVPLVNVIGGVYMLTGQAPGEHTVKVSAFDKAGNVTPQEAKFTIAGALAATNNAIDDTQPQPTNWRLIGDIALIALVAFLLGYLWFERSAFRHEKYLAKREADELRDNMSNVFAALREEIGEQAGRIFQKPNPSAQDREVMETMNEAIDLSEELLSKELEDVRKMLM